MFLRFIGKRCRVLRKNQNVSKPRRTNLEQIGKIKMYKKKERREKSGRSWESVAAIT